LRVLEGVCFRGSFEFEFGFELFLAFFAILLGLPLFMSFVGFAVFPLLDDLLELLVF
jgi:hypothetical protein